MNSKYAIKIENGNASVLEGYVETPKFETVISVGSKYIAAAYAEKGIKIFSVSGNTIQVVSAIEKDNFTTYNELELADLAYYESKNILLALDEDNGVSSFNLT